MELKDVNQLEKDEIENFSIKLMLSTLIINKIVYIYYDLTLGERKK